MGTLRRIYLPVVAGLVAASLAVPLSAPAAGADELEEKRAEAARVADRLDALEAEVMRLDDELERAKGELQEAKAALADAQRRADEADAEVELRTRELRSYAVEAYVSGNDVASFDAVLRSEPDQAPQRRGYLRAATGDRRDLIDELSATKAQAEDEGEALEAARAELAAEHDRLEERTASAERAVEEQAAIKERLDAEIAELVAAEQRRRAEEEARRAEATRAATAQQAARTAGPSASGGTSGTPRPASTAPAPAPSVELPPPPVGSGGGAAVAAAMSRIGSPYVWAAAGPGSFDCSGLTMWAWAQAGRSLPHYSGAQYAMTRRISAAEAQPGDLVFFWAPGTSGDPGHVGLYIGGGSFVHAPGRGKVVRVDSVGYWPGARVAYGRL